MVHPLISILHSTHPIPPLSPSLVIFYSVFFFFGYRVYYQQSFVWPSSLWWQGWDKGEHDLMDPGERMERTRGGSEGEAR